MLKLSLVLFLSVCFLCSKAQSGCTDVQANNYNPGAVTNDGSCTYDSTFAPSLTKGSMAQFIQESSGLVFTDGKLWTHNDSGGLPAIYRVDTANAQITQTVHITNFSNTDWEDICADSNYIYVGDFGNNDGNRTNLKIVKIDKSAIGTSSVAYVTATSVNFSYADQTSYATNSNTNFNCEAMVSINGSLYIFTKNHGDLKTRCYQLPKTPGNYTVSPLFTFNSAGLVTGASYNAFSKEITLIGYLPNHNYSFLWVFNNFTGNNFISGNKRRIEIGSSQKWQTEGVAYINSNRLFVSCETNVVSCSLYTIDKSGWRVDGLAEYGPWGEMRIYPNPVSDKLSVSNVHGEIKQLDLLNASGELLFSHIPAATEITLDLGSLQLPRGLYFLQVKTGQGIYSKKIVLSEH